MVYDERDIRKAQALDIAQKMVVAARTAPKGKGVDVVECAVVDGDDLEALACTMEAVGEERLRIGSAYEPAAVLDALARLAAAPAVWAVWAVTEAGWTEVDVVSDSLRIERPGTLQRLSLEIRPRQRGGRL